MVLYGLKIVSEPVILYRFLRDNGGRRTRRHFEQGMLVIPGSFSCRQPIDMVCRHCSVNIFEDTLATNRWFTFEYNTSILIKNFY